MLNENFDEIDFEKNQMEFFFSIFFLIINFIIYVVVLLYFGINIKIKINIYIILLIIVDIFLRLLNIVLYAKISALFKEIIVSIMTSYECIVVITFFYYFFTINTQIKANKLKIENEFSTLVVFFSFIFIYNTNDSFYIKIIYAITYIINIIFLFLSYKYIFKNIKLFSSYIYYPEKSLFLSIVDDILNNVPFLSTICYIIHYILKINVLLLEDRQFINYLEMIIIFVKEIGKYLTFILLIIMYYVYENYFPKNAQIKYQNKIEINNEKEINVQVYQN